ncbi:MAG: cation diffusion facilitator family transporter [Lactobacillus sp.]|jgi:cobalt-zinc-cadmium efflux system protein|nr:cation diffusion facilitator family transporter [Lactobacillus sp.]MCI1481525.1 cation diffusion facilitator family transporter [Lactobacillus sp.]
MKDQTSRKFIWVSLLNIVITIAEFIGGLVAGSLALVSDALHNLGDVGAIVLSFVAHLLGKKDKNRRKTFGYERSETLATFTNGLVLIVICLFLFAEAISRLFHPTAVKGGIMLIVAVIGLLANAVSMLIMQKDAKQSLNVKSTFIHMMSDALSSLAVVVSAIILSFWQIPWLDPVITMLVSLFVIKEGIEVTKNAANILMESNPDISLQKVNELVLSVPSVHNIHHVHLWRYSDNMVILDAHINVDHDMSMDELEILYRQLDQKLKPLGINHTTFQAECQQGINEDMISPGKRD